MRLSGHLGGRKIEAPAENHTRPTTDRVREAVFNSLGSMGMLKGPRRRPLRGSGAMGIEALSRAAHCTFIENDRAALKCSTTTSPTLGLKRHYRCSGFSRSATPRPDIVLADPPYGPLTGIRCCRLSAPLLVAEVAQVEPIGNWTTLKARRYERTE